MSGDVLPDAPLPCAHVTDQDLANWYEEQPPEAECARCWLARGKEPMTPCDSCGAPLRWAITTTGKRMPLDAEPSATGNVWYCEAERVAVGTPPEGVPRYTSHFATCPNAAQHRRKR